MNIFVDTDDIEVLVSEKMAQKLKREALLKMTWYLRYTEHELANVPETMQEYGPIDARQAKAYEVIKAELNKLKLL